jgi:hypothetical protein
MDDREEYVDRLLNDNGIDDDALNAMWKEELEDLKEQLQLNKSNEESLWQAKTLRAQRTAAKRRKELPGAGAHTLPAYITDSRQFWKHQNNKKERKRLAAVQSSFDQFPELSRHIYKRHIGSKKKYSQKKNIVKICAKTQDCANSRLRNQLKKAAKKVLRCCSADYVERTNETKLLIEISRTTMGSRALLKKVNTEFKLLDEDDETAHCYNGDDFGIDAGLDDLNDPRSPPGSPTKHMLKFLKEKAAFHHSETKRYSR